MPASDSQPLSRSLIALSRFAQITPPETCHLSIFGANPYFSNAILIVAAKSAARATAKYTPELTAAP